MFKRLQQTAWLTSIKGDDTVGTLRKMNQLKKINIAFWLLMSTGFLQISHAGVSLENGNFFMQYVDLRYPSGLEVEIRRVFNSKTPFSGWFGFGWGSKYESHLTISPDGSVVLAEYGGGAQNRFVPVNFKPADLDQAVELISSTAKAAGEMSTSAKMDTYKKRLKSDAGFMNDEYTRFVRAEKLKPKKLPVGSKLRSVKFNLQILTVTNTGFTRLTDAGILEDYDEGGRLRKISDRNNHFIKFDYAKDGNPVKLEDEASRKVFFSFDGGLLRKIEGENKQVSTYKYSPQRELIESKDVDGNIYSYKYSNDGRHNLIEIAYSDKTTLQIAYYGLDKRENVKSIKDRDGTVTSYDYKFDGDNHLTVTVKITSDDNRLLSTNVYEYFKELKENGEKYTKRLITTFDGDRTDTVYDKVCVLPKEITRGNDKTTFKFDELCHVIEKVTPTEITRLQYNSKVNKVSHVAHYSLPDQKEIDWSDFGYDERGNLDIAKNSQGKAVKLAYDGSGRIKAMIDEKREEIDFKYNADSKPIEIRDPKLGSITVDYYNSGDIKNVESKAGHEIAVKVTAEFETLLQIVSPAGVTLSFGNGG